MSYILDALRKSDEEHRKNGARPIRSGFSFSRRPVSRQRRNAFGLILAGCMLIAGLLLGFGLWWSRWDPQQAPVGSAREAVRERSEEDVRHSSRTAEAEAPQVTPVSSSAQKKQAETGAVDRTENQTVSIPEPSNTFRDMKQRLADLQFSGHVYSPAPELRMIMINNTVVREGQVIAPDLSLIEITRTGVVLSFHGTPHQIDLF